MVDFQKYLDNALQQIKIPEEPVPEPPQYDIYAEISALIENTRDELGMTQKDLAEKSGLTQANISKIEGGACHPTIASLKKIADAFGKRLSITMENVEDYLNDYDSSILD